MCIATISAVSIVFGQAYCLAYRFTVILEDKRLYDFFVSRAGYAAGHLFYFLCAFGISCTMFNAIADPQVIGEQRD